MEVEKRKGTGESSALEKLNPFGNLPSVESSDPCLICRQAPNDIRKKHIPAAAKLVGEVHDKLFVCLVGRPEARSGCVGKLTPQSCVTTRGHSNGSRLGVAVVAPWRR